MIHTRHSQVEGNPDIFTVVPKCHLPTLLAMELLLQMKSYPEAERIGQRKGGAVSFESAWRTQSPTCLTPHTTPCEVPSTLWTSQFESMALKGP